MQTSIFGTQIFSTPPRRLSAPQEYFMKNLNYIQTTATYIELGCYRALFPKITDTRSGLFVTVHLVTQVP